MDFTTRELHDAANALEAMVRNLHGEVAMQEFDGRSSTNTRALIAQYTPHIAKFRAAAELAARLEG